MLQINQQLITVWPSNIHVSLVFRLDDTISILQDSCKIWWLLLCDSLVLALNGHSHMLSHFYKMRQDGERALPGRDQMRCLWPKNVQLPLPVPKPIKEGYFRFSKWWSWIFPYLCIIKHLKQLNNYSNQR